MLYKKLIEYSKENVYPFHMPGHKRSTELFDGIIPYNIDLTEINGFDSLQNPTGIIKSLEKKAADIYGVNYAFLLINGATCGILAAIRAMTNYGDSVLIARNCHKSVYNAIELCGLKPIYLLPKIDEAFGISSCIDAADIEAQLSKHSEIKLIIITSPTYEGVVSNINSISRCAQKYNVKLFVDEAHGAHFPFSDKFPEEAVSCGADAAVVSLHKTLPSLTQTALLLTNSSSVQNIYENLSIFETSSPSYILMSSIERCLDYISSNRKVFDSYIMLLNDFSEKCKALKNIKVLCKGKDNNINHSFYDFDIGKLVISLKGLNINGAEFSELLRKKYKIEVEMAYTDYAILITSICDSAHGFKLLYEALYEIDESYSVKNRGYSYVSLFNELPFKLFDPCKKNAYEGRFYPISEAYNKISLEYLWTYPPGVPLLVPGEKIDERLVKNIMFLVENGVDVYSTKGEIPNRVYCCEI